MAKDKYKWFIVGNLSDRDNFKMMKVKYPIKNLRQQAIKRQYPNKTDIDFDDYNVCICINDYHVRIDDVSMKFIESEMLTNDVITLSVDQKIHDRWDGINMRKRNYTPSLSRSRSPSHEARYKRKKSNSPVKEQDVHEFSINRHNNDKTLEVNIMSSTYDKYDEWMYYVNKDYDYLESDPLRITLTCDGKYRDQLIKTMEEHGYKFIK